MKKQIVQLSLAVCLSILPSALAQNVFPTNGNVGIGTLNPEHPVDVRGGVSVSDDSTEGGYLFLKNPRKIGTAASLWALYNTTGHHGESFQIWNYPQNGQPSCCRPQFIIHDDGTTVLTPSGGNVGIGTTTPQAKLDVTGQIFTRGAESGFGIVAPNGSAWHWNLRGDVGGNKDDLKLLRYVNNVYQEIAVQFENATGNAIFPKKVSVNTLELTSDRDKKQDFQTISTAEVLDKLSQLSVVTWAYTNSPNVRHLGPMAQDFKAAFNLGEDDKHIGAGDGIGVALAAIKGLHELVQEKNSEIAALQAQNASLQRQVANVTKQVAGIQDAVAAIAKAMPKNGTQQASFRSEATR